MRSIPKRFYDTPAWKSCRDAYMNYCGGLCERCKAEGKIVPADIVHHKEHLNSLNFHDPAVAYNFENLEALCLDHHNAEHFRERKTRRWNFCNSSCIKVEDDEDFPR